VQRTGDSDSSERVLLSAVLFANGDEARGLLSNLPDHCLRPNPPDDVADFADLVSRVLELRALGT